MSYTIKSLNTVTLNTVYKNIYSYDFDLFSQNSDL